MAAPGSHATADLKDKDGKLVGKAVLHEVADGVLVRLDVKGLTPGLHAVHVHAVGKCEGPDLPAPADILIPAAKNMVLRVLMGRTRAICRTCWLRKTDQGDLRPRPMRLRLRAGSDSVFDADGSALVIHVGVDDYVTDPTGNAGDRAACGLIVAAK